MGLLGKTFLIFFITIICCSKVNLLKNDKEIEIRVNSLELWYDAMPKVQSRSLLHFVVDYSLKNIIKKNIVIDSVNFEIVLSKNLTFILIDENQNQVHLKLDETKNFYHELTTTGSKEILEHQFKKSKIFMNLFLKVSGNSLIKKVFLGEKEIQVVY